MERMLVIDGHNLLFRMFFGIPYSVKNSQGREIKGAMGFVGNIKKLIQQFKPAKLVVVFDTETSTVDRLNTDENYKQNRVDYSHLPEDENPFTQLKYIYQALTYLNICYHEARGYEADDYIASLCEVYKNEYAMTIVSTDKDFLQLVDSQVSVYNPMADIYYTPEQVYEKFNVLPEQIVDFKILVGDPSDNIKGVPQIGKKTAVKILTIGSLAQILNQDCEIEPKFFNKLMEHQSILEKNRTLITMNRSIDIEIELESFELDQKIDQKTHDILVACGVF